MCSFIYSVLALIRDVSLFDAWGVKWAEVQLCTLCRLLLGKTALVNEELQFLDRKYELTIEMLQESYENEGNLTEHT